MFLKTIKLNRTTSRLKTVVTEISNQRGGLEWGCCHGGAIYAKRIKSVLIGRLSNGVLKWEPG